VNWLLVFIIANCFVLGGAVWQVQRKIDRYSISETVVLGVKKGEDFIYPLGLKQGDDTFLQLAHRPSNTKVSFFLAPTVSSNNNDEVVFETDIEKIFQTLRTYKPGVPHAVQSGIFKFLRGQFDTRRALAEETLNIQNTRFIRVLVNKKDHYIVGVMSRKEAQVAIVAFNADHAVSQEVIRALFQEYPEFYEKWRIRS